MKVISLVPSWTETLLLAGIEVVGRTRFCIHPAEMVKDIPVVGGTKEIDWDKVYELEADLVLLDQEENPLSLAEECTLPFIATHVTSIEAMAFELGRLGDEFKNQQLKTWGLQTQEVLNQGRLRWNQERIPGFLQWLRPPTRQCNEVIYFIWKKPWMCAARDTYIGSVIDFLGGRIAEFPDEGKYPTLNIEDRPESLFLFSSEPFPFHKKIAEISGLEVSGRPIEGAIVDGEAYSWFGKRGLDFLRLQVKLQSN